VEVLTLDAVCRGIEKNRNEKNNRMRIHDIFISRCKEGEFDTPFQRLRKVQALTGLGLGPAAGLRRRKTENNRVQMIAIKSYIGQFLLRKGNMSQDSRYRLKKLKI
jgi:hypothetical protein